MFAADLFLKVDVLSFKAGLLALHYYPVSDVHKHCARVRSANIRTRPPLNPNRLAIVFPAQFEHDAACVRSAANRFKGLTKPALGLKSLRHEISAICPLDLL